MSPYDLPEEFSHLQALDMSRLGFMQDLIRGIKKSDTILSCIPHTVVEIMTSDDEKRKQLFIEYIEMFNSISNSD